MPPLPYASAPPAPVLPGTVVQPVAGAQGGGPARSSLAVTAVLAVDAVLAVAVSVATAVIVVERGQLAAPHPRRQGRPAVPGAASAAVRRRYRALRDRGHHRAGVLLPLRR
ncbi:hypothetical protein ABZ404_32435 [Streptomyces sp. NPDC005878]|uniref:hypothetical protein n=1 Tax=Streptomyces sp. NPDC005878 TaxID=3157077 RepID=UPI0033E205A0